MPLASMTLPLNTSGATAALDDLDLLQGTLDLLILKTLTWGPMHGYAVARWISDTTDDDLQIEEGALYTALHRMEKRGWLDERVGPLREQSQGEVLPAHHRRAESSCAARRTCSLVMHSAVFKVLQVAHARGLVTRYHTDSTLVLPRGIRRLFRIELDPRRVARAVDDELRFHFDMTVRHHMEQRNERGRRTSRSGAPLRRRRATRGRASRRSIDRAPSAIVASSGGARCFRTSATRCAVCAPRPAFTIVVVLALALGVGANATMFGIIDRLLFRPPPFLAAPSQTNLVYLGAHLRRRREPARRT